MANNESFKKKELNKEDYSKKENGAKVVKGFGIFAAALAILPKLIKGFINVVKSFKS